MAQNFTIRLQKLTLAQPVSSAALWLSVRDWLWCLCLCVCVDSLLPRPQSCSPQSSYYYWAVDHFSAVDPWGDASVTPLQPKSIFLFIHQRFAPFLLFPPMLTLFLPHEACKCSMRQRFCQLITISFNTSLSCWLYFMSGFFPLSSFFKTPTHHIHFSVLGGPVVVEKSL